VSLDGILDEKNPRQKRVKILSEDQREAIQSLSSASQIPHDERKRQWGALHRRLKQPGLPAGLIEKWADAKTSSQKFYAQLFVCSEHLIKTSFNSNMVPSSWLMQPRFEFLKCFLADPSMQSMEIEVYHQECHPYLDSFLKILCTTLLK